MTTTPRPGTVVDRHRVARPEPDGPAPWPCDAAATTAVVAACGSRRDGPTTWTEHGPWIFRVFVEPQPAGASHRRRLATAQVAEDLGYDGFFRSDHYLPGQPAIQVA